MSKEGLFTHLRDEHRFPEIFARSEADPHVYNHSFYLRIHDDDHKNMWNYAPNGYLFHDHKGPDRKKPDKNTPK